MKKLMIAATAAMLGIAVHAATTSWSINDYSLPEDVSDCYAFLVLNNGNTKNGVETYLLATALTDVYTSEGNGSVAFLSKALADSDGVSAVGIDNYMGEGLGMAGDSEGIVNGQAEVGAYLVLLNNSDIDKATKACIIQGVDGDGALATTDFAGNGYNEGYYFGDIADYAGNSENWHAVGAVPEPTSGLLLLLGVAGLALRRRRA